MRNASAMVRFGWSRHVIKVELKGFQEALGIWDEKPVRRAAASALKKVSASALSTASAEIRAVYNVKKSDLDPRIKIRPPGTDDLTAVIIVSGKGISLSYFGARQFAVNRTISRTGKGLKVKTRKRSAQFMGVEVEVEKDKRTQLRSAFLAQMTKSGHIGVMRRVGKKRLPIQEKQVISLASMIQKSDVQPAVLEKVQAAWDTTFPHELEYQLSKAKKS